MKSHWGVGAVEDTAQKSGTHWEGTGREEDRSGGMAMGMGMGAAVTAVRET